MAVDNALAMPYIGFNGLLFTHPRGAQTVYTLHIPTFGPTFLYFQ